MVAVLVLFVLGLAVCPPPVFDDYFNEDVKVVLEAWLVIVSFTFPYTAIREAGYIIPTGSHSNFISMYSHRNVVSKRWCGNFVLT